MTIISQLRAQFQTPVIPRAAVIAMLRITGLGNHHTYEAWREKKIIKPIKNIPGASRSRYLRDDVLYQIEQSLTVEE